MKTHQVCLQNLSLNDWVAILSIDGVLKLLVSEDEDDELDIDYSGEVEIRIIPSDGVSVHDLFRTVQECNKLHPYENDG